MEILFQDEFILAINKPSGLNSIPDGYQKDLPYVRSLLEPEFGRLWNVHRLDKETSGVLLLARSARVHRQLNDQFAAREVKKTYVALAMGNFPTKQECTLPLRINGDRRHRTIVDFTSDKKAKTNFELAEVFFDKISLIKAFPDTGYTHQIRIHALSLGYPLLGDKLYSTQNSRELSRSLNIERTALHNQSITFTHPVSGNATTINAPFPPDFQEMLAQIKTKGASL